MTDAIPAFPLRLAQLAGDARSETAPHKAKIMVALQDIEASLDAIRAMGVSVEISWPYGRGEVAKATNAKINMSLKVDL